MQEECTIRQNVINAMQNHEAFISGHQDEKNNINQFRVTAEFLMNYAYVMVSLINYQQYIMQSSRKV